MEAAMRRFSPLPVRSLATCAVAALFLAGCAADYSTYPSLARRPADDEPGAADRGTRCPSDRLGQRSPRPGTIRAMALIQTAVVAVAVTLLLAVTRRVTTRITD